MPLLPRVRSLLLNLLHARRADRALDQELDGYLALLTDEKIAAGLPPGEARRAALVELGGREQVKERVRAVRAGALLSELAQDVRYGVRMLRRSPGFALVAIVTLALGIGANTAIFGIVDALLFRPLPIADPGRVVAFYLGTTGTAHAFSYPEYVDYRAADSHLAGVAAWGGGNRAWLRVGADLDRVDVELVSGNYFDLLGLRAALGRTFTPADDDFRAPRGVAVISHRLWRTTFAANPAIAGQVVTVNGQSFTIVGVAPSRFNGLAVEAPPDMWVPLAAVSLLEPGWKIDDRREMWLSLIARLREDSDARAAQASVQPVAARAGVARDGMPGTVRLLPASAGSADPDAREAARRTASLVMAIVAFVLIIACANVASLVLARGASRTRELSVRLAIGATRGRVARQVMAESAILALASGLAALVVARWTTGLVVALAPAAAIPPGLDLSLDVRVIGFAIVVSALTAMVFGAAPAWYLARLDPLTVTHGTGRGVTGGARAAMRLRAALVLTQVALSIVLLVGASLLVRTLAAAQEVPSGYSTGKVLLVALDFSVLKVEPAESLATANRVVERARAIPGVEAAGFGQVVPFSGSMIQRPAVREGLPARDEDLVPYSVVGEGYFVTLGMTLRGRDFRASDNQAAPRVIVINETLARSLFPGENALGKRMQLPLKEPGPPFEVVGVVSDAKYVSPMERQAPFMYLPLAQTFRPRLTLHVRTSGSPAAFTAAVRSAVHDVSPDLPAFSPSTLDERLARSLARERLVARLLSVFSVVALVIAAVGIYGMVAYAVARRTREMGVRLALGAAPAALARLVVRQTATLLLIGVAVGIAAALVLTRFIASFLFGVTPTDPVAFAAAVAVLVTVAFVAACIPARRAARVDPLVALRSE